MAKESKEKKPTIKTLEDKGTKIDLVDFGDGRQAFFYQTEKFRGLGIGAFRLGWTDKYNVISPQELTYDQISGMARTVSVATGSNVLPSSFVVHSPEEKQRKEKPSSYSP